VNLADAGGWPAVLGALTAGEDLGAAEAGAALGGILDGQATSAQIAAFCVALRMKGETVDEMTGMLDTMLEHAESVPLDGDGLVDTCGTGGDQSGSINVSTIAAVVVAGAGARVCKHGNRAASSQCGSADVLEALGVVIDLSPTGVATCVERAGLGFCFAPRFHPALRHAGPTRKELGVRTVFNFLGPLANPARVRRQALGVSDPAMAETVMGVLKARGAERALVFYGHDGLDELTTTAPSTVLELRDGEVQSYVVDPSDFGIPVVSTRALRGGEAAGNAEMARRVLDGEAGPHRDIVVLNAAAGIVAAGLADDLAEGAEVATAAIDDGGAAKALDGMAAVSQEFADS
jgi:anthranilate phosphoribosyltransferase